MLAAAAAAAAAKLILVSQRDPNLHVRCVHMVLTVFACE